VKRILLLAAIAVFSVLSNETFAQTGWFKQKIDSRISAKFPKEPKLEGPGYKVKGNDSVVYAVNTMDLGAMGLDSATIATMAPTEEFAEQLKAGFAAQIPGFEVTKMDIGTWKDFTVYDIEGEQAEKKIKMYFKCIFINTRLYAFIATVPEKGDVKNKDTFFTSIELN
jgi:hypothetical protein